MTGIEDLGLIGDQQTAALVDRDGSVVWMCWPAFDGDPLLCHLLDEDGGSWSLDAGQPVGRRYLDDTAVLEQRFRRDGAEVVVTDLMVVPSQGGRWLVRRCTTDGAVISVSSRLRLTPGFGRGRARPEAIDSGAAFGDDAGGLRFTTNGHVSVTGDEVRVTAEVSAGQPLVMVLGDRAPDAGPLPAWAQNRIERTVDHWRRWVGSCALPSTGTEIAARSAITVKLLIHEPSGAVVAAPTTSLPEQIGGTRNWDYRYAWLRDASMAIRALERLGRYDEAMAFWDWLERAVRRRNDPPSVAYTIGADLVPAEVPMDHLSGYRGSTPVRVGNAATDQLQLDVYGHVLSAAAHCYDRMDLDHAHPANVLASFADQAADRWREPDASIWEVRSGPKRHLYSVFQCWIALRDAARLGEEGALEGDARRWARTRDEVAADLLEEGWNDEVGAFTQTLGGSELDASALALVASDLLPDGDPRAASTVHAIERELAHGPLVRRYQNDDGLPEGEGAFFLCSLWLADAHMTLGDLDRAEEILHQVEAMANDLGLLSEEVDIDDGRLLGNFPQALTHLGLINALVRLDECRSGGRERRRGG